MAAGATSRLATPSILHLPAGEGRPLLDGRMVLKVAAADADDAYTLCLGVTPPGLGPPLHLHALDDQTHYVIRGTYELICGPDVVTVGAGACVHMPRYTPHTFRNVGAETAELVEFTAPGGIDKYFDAVAHLGPVAMDLDARNEVGKPFGISFPDDPEDYLEPPPGELRRPATYVEEGEGRQVDVSGYVGVRKIDLADTGGSHSLTELSLPAGAKAALDSPGWLALFVLDGAITIEAGDGRTEATPGDSVAVSSEAGAAVVATGEWPARFVVYAVVGPS